MCFLTDVRLDCPLGGGLASGVAVLVPVTPLWCAPLLFDCWETVDGAATPLTVQTVVLEIPSVETNTEVGNREVLFFSVD